jgi:hypothetical protein
MVSCYKFFFVHFFKNSEIIAHNAMNSINDKFQTKQIHKGDITQIQDHVM